MKTMLLRYSSIVFWFTLRALCVLILLIAGWIGQTVWLLAVGPEPSSKNGKRQAKEIILKF